MMFYFRWVICYEFFVFENWYVVLDNGSIGGWFFFDFNVVWGEMIL